MVNCAMRQLRKGHHFTLKSGRFDGLGGASKSTFGLRAMAVDSPGALA